MKERRDLFLLEHSLDGLTLNEMLAWGFGYFHSIFSLLKLILCRLKHALEHPNKPAEAAVAETTAKALVSVDHLAAGKAA